MDKNSKGSLETVNSSEESKSSTSINVHSSKAELIADEPAIPKKSSDSDSEIESSSVDNATENERKRKIRVGAMMCIAYASNIGGTASLIGSSPQLALKGILYE